MALRSNRDMTVEEFYRWSDACRDVREVMEATAEEGGPRVSQVPEPTSAPLDFLPDEVQLPPAQNLRHRQIDQLPLRRSPTTSTLRGPHEVSPATTRRPPLP